MIVIFAYYFSNYTLNNINHLPLVRYKRKVKIMKVALIGATGYVGSAILKELLARDYDVTAIVRDKTKLNTQSNLKVIEGDVMQQSALAQVFTDVDVVVSAYNSGWSNPNIFEDFIKGSHAIIAAAKQAQVKRLFVIGGAGSLYVAPNLQLIDTPDFPKDYYDGANGARVLLDELKKEQNLNWTMLSPPIAFSMRNPTVSTGQYRVGTDEPLMDGDQPGNISDADLAIAVVDELEQQKFIRRRFTVAK